MTAAPPIKLEEDPVPIVRIIGARLARAVRYPEFRSRLRKVRGSFALASNKDPQALTITIDGDAIHLVRGVSREAKITIWLDFENLNAPPNVIGVFRHPLFTWRVAKLMEFPKESWTDAAKRFWDQVGDAPQMPGGIKIVCTDDDQELDLGNAEVEIHGSDRALEELFTGSAILVQAIMKGQIRFVGSLRHAAVLSGATMELMLGGIHYES